MDGKVLYVRDFFPHYVRSQALRGNSIYWVAQSTKLSNPRYFLLMERDPSGQFYGVFRIMIAVAGQGKPTGTLTGPDGSAYGVSALSRLTKISQAALRKALPWLIEKKFLWLADSVEIAAAVIDAERRSESDSERDSERNSGPARRRTRTHTTPQELKSNSSPLSPPHTAAPLASGAAVLPPDEFAPSGRAEVQSLLRGAGVEDAIAGRLAGNFGVTRALVAPLAEDCIAAAPDNPTGWVIARLRELGAIPRDWGTRS